MVFHVPTGRFSIGARIDENGNVYMAVAGCHPRDRWSKQISNAKIAGRLYSDKESVNLGKLEFSKPNDIYGPMRDAVRHVVAERNSTGAYVRKLGNKRVTINKIAKLAATEAQRASDAMLTDN